MFSLITGDSSEGSESRPNILLFTIDACRPDHFSCYGYNRNTTPNIDKLAGEGALFTNAFSQSAWTTPAMISIFTSLYPPSHGVDAKGKTLREGIPTLPQILKENGYKTPVLPRFVDIPNYWHLGFDEVNKELFQGKEGDDLLKLLEAFKNQNFFIWYHYHGLHLPYNPTAPYDGTFKNDASNKTPSDSEAVSAVKMRSVVKNGSVNFNDTDKRTITSLYDGQLLDLDNFMGQLIEGMKKWGLSDNTLIIIVSDHGEELLEHGFIGHASTSLNAKLYDEIIRIPFIIWWPRKIKHTIIDEVVQQVDIMPTILDMLNVPVPDGLQGNSMSPLMLDKHAGKSMPSLPGFGQGTVFCETILGGYQSTKEMENIRLRCIRTKDWKLICTNTLLNNMDSGGQINNRCELYDLRNDPKEERNVIEKHPEVAKELKKKLSLMIGTATAEKGIHTKD